MSGSGLNVALLEQAIREGSSDVIGVAHEVGASAARLGVPLHEVLDHVERAFAPLEPRHAAVRAAAVAWAERSLVQHADVGCEDPLTTLATLPYVRSRLAEIYRGAARAGRRAGDTTVLVVVELARPPDGHELEQSLRALDVAGVLRTVFAGDETIARLSAQRFAALVERERIDDLTMRLLGLLLERATGPEASVRLFVEHLPAAADDIGRLVAGLVDPTGSSDSSSRPA